MRYKVQGTLDYVFSAAQFQQYSSMHFAHALVVAKQTKEVLGDLGGANLRYPDREALAFYGLNHLVGLIRKHFSPYEVLPPLEQSIVGEYLNAVIEQGVRMFHYMLLITTRESRHAKDKPGFWDEFLKLFPKKLMDFNRSLVGKGSEGAASTFLSSPPDSLLEPYVASLVYIFKHGKFSGGYGGKPWGKIAQTLHSFLTGTLSMEAMIDTAYTLAHNNGPMFNKGMLYHQYSSHFIKILDVQRSGQIPEFLLTHKVGQGLGNDTNYPCYKLIDLYVKDHPQDFGAYVDWHKVEAMGSLHKYPEEKKAQDKVKGVKTSGSEKYLEIFPGQSVMIFHRKVAA